MSLPWDLFVSAFVTLLVVIDPPGAAPIFASLTARSSPEARKAMAIRSVVIASVILFGFAAVGEPFLRALGISLDAFRVAGGIMLFLIALDMVFETRVKRREERAKAVNDEETEDVSVFPMAMPMIAGPGSIAAVMLLTGKAGDSVEKAAVYLALAIVLLLTLAALLAAGPIMRRIGAKVEGMITRLLGVILAALAAQIVIDGLKGAFG
ncbi:MarC family protein [Sandaracinobacter sp. RS1-74]|uniref:MarC family protein n=1 Tax=Sandaracinobacteroides sayramensis TaxID=2913411 RepID=UPI001EDC646D|nr:MarC family protein [Sandaracinobacteroides sayramensis]MCG2842723.1 MarC family protein [Sandaracinobacteroides sayramensis]